MGNGEIPYYMHDGSAALRFKLTGDLSDDCCRELEQAWRTASSTLGRRKLVVDLDAVTGIDEAAGELLRLWQREGGTLVASGGAARSLVESIPGIALAPVPVGGNFEKSFGWSPRSVFRFLGVLALLIPLNALAAHLAVARPDSAQGAAFARYLASTRERSPFNDSGAVMIEVDASLPELYKQSRLLALRRVGESERSEYLVLAVEGDLTVTQEVITPYLAVQDLIETLPESAVAVTPENYKFHYVGELGTGAGSTYRFRITPKKKRDGLIEGELWIDSLTGIGVLQKGYFVRTPSGFDARIQVVRDTMISNGVPCARVTHIAIETRRAGHGELTVREYPVSAGGELPASPGSDPEPTTRVLRGSFIP